MAFSFQQLNNALTNCTSYWLRKATDNEGQTVFLLLDGCGDQDGDPFESLEDVADYITNNQDVADYLACQYA